MSTNKPYDSKINDEVDRKSRDLMIFFFEKFMGMKMRDNGNPKDDRPDLVCDSDTSEEFDLFAEVEKRIGGKNWEWVSGKFPEETVHVPKRKGWYLKKRQNLFLHNIK